MERFNFPVIEKKWRDKLSKKKLYNKNGKKFYCEFHSEEGRKYWFHGFIEDKNQYFHPPLV